MKVVKQTHSVKTNVVESKAFGIVFDRHMVNILSNQLYEDKVLAIVRELSTNALDSQIEAKYDGAFDVHMPLWNDLIWWIRDYGTGMSPEKISTIYSNYGKSDRNESNDFTGCMGLGSKTPFCYNTKTFTVDSWYDGVHYTYACYLNDEGMPQISLMSQEASDEHSGVKISLAVNSSDKYLFRSAMESVYKFFTVQPHIVNWDINIDYPKYDLEDGNWKYDSSDSYNGMKIIMGNVAYDVNATALGSLTREQKQVVNLPFHVYVPIGEVSPTASREGLDYTNRTKTHIRRYINEIITSFTNKVQNDINSCKNLWEARLKLNSINQNSLDGIFDSSKLMYNGQVVGNIGFIDLSQMVKDEKLSLELFPYTRWRKNKHKKTIQINITKNMRFYHNDMKIGGFVRAEAEKSKHQSNVILVTFKTPTAKQEFFDIVGIDDTYLTDISTIPSPTIITRKKRGTLTRVVQFVPTASYYKNRFWNNVEIDFSKGGVYIEFNRFSCKFNGQFVHPKEISAILHSLQRAGINFENIYGVKTKDIKQFKKMSNWVNFEDYVRNKLLDFIKGKDFLTPIKYADAIKHVGGKHRNLDYNEIVKIMPYCKTNTLFYKFARLFDLYVDKSKNVDQCKTIKLLCQQFNIVLPQPKVKLKDLYVMEDEVYRTYHLLSSLSQYANILPYEHIGMYINSVVKGAK